MTLYQVKVIHSLDQTRAELYDYITGEFLASGTPEEVEEDLARRIREAGVKTDITALRPHR
jgi:hypothetical protein